MNKAVVAAGLWKALKSFGSVRERASLRGQQGRQTKRIHAVNGSSGREGLAAVIAAMMLIYFAAPLGAEEAWRQWRDNAGKYQVRAKLVEQTANEVKLLREDGQVVQVPIERLGAADQDYLARRAIKPHPKPVIRTDEQLLTELSPELLATLKRAIASLEAKQVKAALTDLRVVLKSAPESRTLRLLLATCQHLDGRDAEAIETLTNLLEEYPQDLRIREMRANYYEARGEYPQAVLDFAMILAREPDNQGVLNNLAWILATAPQDRIRNGAKAVELANKACKLSDYQVPYQLSTLAAAYAEKGEFDEACEWSARALQLAKDQRLATVGVYEAELDCFLLDRPWRIGTIDVGTTGPNRRATSVASSPVDAETMRQLDEAQRQVASNSATQQTAGFETFRRYAAQQIGPAYGGLGACYLQGRGTAVNNTEAFRAFSRGAELNDPRSLNGLGICYFYGLGMKADQARGMDYWEKAFAGKSTLAALHLGSVYSDGNGVPRDAARAARYFRFAAYKGAPLGMALLGKSLCTGEGLRQDINKGLQWLQKSAEAEDLLGMQLLGQQLLSGQPSPSQSQLGMQWLTRAAEQGSTSSMLLLGQYYRHGVGVSADARQAIAWWERAIQAGELSALGNLGELYINSEPPIRDDAKGVTFLQRAVAQGDARANFWLGFCYLDGRGVAANENEAERYFRESKRLGNVNADSMLAHIEQSRKERATVTARPQVPNNRFQGTTASRSGWSNQGNVAAGAFIVGLLLLMSGSDSFPDSASDAGVNDIARRQAEINRHQAEYWRQRAERERASGYLDEARSSQGMAEHLGGF